MSETPGGARFVLGLRCPACGREHAARGIRYLCGGCQGNLEVVYDYARMRKAVTRRGLGRDRDTSIWRYLPMLPVPDRPRGPWVHVGGTPLYRAGRLGKQFGLTDLWLKDDGRNPSASFKDRAGAVAIAKAMQMRRKVITGASTGNAASSLACLAASLGIRPVVFVPRAAPAAKLTQLLVFGATVLAVDGTYDQAFDLCREASDAFGWFNRNTGYNPYTREGKKTCAYEIVEQLGWEVPDLVFVSVGDGNILSGLWKGFRDLQALGLVDRLPRMVAVQASGSNAVARAFASDGVIRPVKESTLADSISVSFPRDGDAAVRALRESGGFCVEVGDEEILDAIARTARAEGVFGEPAGVTPVAGLRKAAGDGRVGAHERVVVVVTGNGLKDIASARRAVGEPNILAPELGAVTALLPGLGL